MQDPHDLSIMLEQITKADLLFEFYKFIHSTNK